MIIRCTLIALLVAGSAAHVHSSDLGRKPLDSSSVTVKTPEHSFNISVPRDWKVDQSGDVPEGFLAVSYPRGASWRTASIILLATAYPKTSERLTLNGIISNDISDFRRGEPKNRVLNARSLQTGDGKTAIVKYYLGDSGEVNNATAYIDEGKTVAELVMSTKDEDDLYSSKAIFEQFVGSYRRSKR